jgi:septum formation protein
MTAWLMNSALILASKSPRRRDLLMQVGLSFAVVPSNVRERATPGASPEEHVRCLAEAKAADVAARNPDKWVLGADTEVVIDHSVLGKPRDPAEAGHMLRTLSGKIHRVVTGYCVRCEERRRSVSDTVETKVQFRPLTEADIEWYINTGEPFDKAGGYAAQGLGTVLIKRIEGSYTNVVGLPVCEVMERLLEEGIVRRQ